MVAMMMIARQKVMSIKEKKFMTAMTLVIMQDYRDNVGVSSDLGDYKDVDDDNKTQEYGEYEGKETL